MNNFGTRRLFWIAIPCSIGALLCFVISIGFAIKMKWFWLALEGFITYCFASSAIHYWRKYYAQKERSIKQNE
jgi:hypothetical protein